MTKEKGGDNYKLTFSQREEKTSLPETMQLEHVPQLFRQLAWVILADAISELSSSEDHYVYFSSPRIPDIIFAFQFFVQSIPHDEITRYVPSVDKNFARKLILHGDYHETLTFIEYILRHEGCTEELYASFAQLFEREPIAYSIEKINDSPTIFPRISREAGKAVQEGIGLLEKGDMESASAHLRQAAEHINARQFADSITDSIHAVESVARIIDPKNNKTLGPALDSLERAGLLKHPALKGAFKQLYGYTSNEQGVRHALINKDAADVGRDEAVFMFGACACFAAFLSQKHREAG